MLGMAEALSGAIQLAKAAKTAGSVGNKISGIEKTKSKRLDTIKKRGEYAKKLFKGEIKDPTKQNLADKEHLSKHDRRFLHKLGLTDADIGG